MRLVLTNANLIDCVRPSPIPGASITVENGRIVKDGASPRQILLAATKHAAELCGAGHDLGTVEVGKVADLIVVRHNPRHDTNNLRFLELVFKEGRVVADHREPVT